MITTLLTTLDSYPNVNLLVGSILGPAHPLPLFKEKVYPLAFRRTPAVFQGKGSVQEGTTDDESTDGQTIKNDQLKCDRKVEFGIGKTMTWNHCNEYATCSDCYASLMDR